MGQARVEANEMFELLANYKDLKTITWTESSATAQGGPYGCMPTYSNWNCVISPAPSASPPPPVCPPASQGALGA